jgi:hypothetical protein
MLYTILGCNKKFPFANYFFLNKNFLAEKLAGETLNILPDWKFLRFGMEYSPQATRLGKMNILPTTLQREN